VRASFTLLYFTVSFLTEAYPHSMNVIELKAGSESFDGLHAAERPTPKPGSGQVRVRMEAASLNYRDLMVAHGTYPGSNSDAPVVPLSDGAGVVDAVGEGAARFEPGDRVTNTFSQVPIDRGSSAERQALGSPLDGTLAEQKVFHENGLVRVPDALSFEEAATLPCAGATAWQALFGAGTPVRPGHTVLTLGTGGVSSFALLFARAAGARVIITSSSDEKLERARELGADGTINYEDTPDWHEAVLENTGGRGADCVVETGGAGTLERSFQAVAPGGKVGLIGVLAEADHNPSPYPLMQRHGHLHGIYVGDVDQPVASFEAMNAAIEANEIAPVIDRTFEFEDATAAYQFQASGTHFGKVVVTI
jgi:NADPH:quinone reductase-like Zn-dependent oxidoreductase